MENFVAYNPTKVHFGKAVVKELGEVASELGRRALLVYGKGSVMRNGSYNGTYQQLKDAGLEIIEYKGIKPNPVVEYVDAAVEIGLQNKVDMVVGVGGGSTIDSAKVIAACITGNCKAWDFMKGKVELQQALPIIAVLTLAATASEMNSIAVLQNDETKEKFGYRHPVFFPAHSFLDPTYTATVPADHTANGIADLIAHALEAYFGQGDASLSDRIVESIILEAFDFGPSLMENLEDYNLRARMMWAATNALNGLTSAGRANLDAASHGFGHQLSLLYDTAHGSSLTIAFPAWMKHMAPRVGHRIEKLGTRLFGDPSIENTIGRFEDFFRKINLPVRLKELGLDQSNRDEILDLVLKNQCNSKNPENSLDDNDRAVIVDLMFSN